MMPCDYKKYPSNWKTEIRPAILERAGNKCEKCNVLNGRAIMRGEWKGIECYQCPEYGEIYRADTSERIGADYFGTVHPTNNIIIIVLTIAHLDHDINNNDYDNLKAMCQRCHNRHDIEHRKANRKETRKKNKGEISLFD